MWNLDSLTWWVITTTFTTTPFYDVSVIFTSVYSFFYSRRQT